MAAANDGSEADEARRQEEFAKNLARLSDEKRSLYERHLNNTIDRNAEAGHQYRMALADTLLKNLPALAENRDIQELNRIENQRVAWKMPPAERDSSRSLKQSAHSIRTADTGDRAPEVQPKLRDPMAGVRPNGPPRDSSELQKTQDEAAQRRHSADPATAPLSKQQLQEMSERYAEVRKAGNLQPTPSELRERSDLAKAQSKDAEKVERPRDPLANAQQTQQRALLEHQHLAERVGVEARWIGQHLRNQRAPGAESYERESRSALHTARLVHQQRQCLGPGMDRAREAALRVQRQDEQKQADAQEAARGGKSLTSEQRVNASADARQTIDRMDRAAAAREIGARSRDQGMHQGPTRPGNGRAGGRSR